MSSIVNKFAIFQILPESIRQNIKSFYAPLPHHAICVTKDDKVYALEEFIRVCGYSERFEDKKYVLITELCNKKIMEFFTGTECIYAKTVDNKIYSAGSNEFGQLGRVAWTDNEREPGSSTSKDTYFKPKKVDFFDDKNIVDISCGSTHCTALSEGGLVYGWSYKGDFIRDEDLCLEPNKSMCSPFPFLIDHEYGFGEKAKHIHSDIDHALVLSVSNYIYISYENSWQFKTKITTFSDVKIAYLSMSDHAKLHQVWLLRHNNSMVSLDISKKPENDPPILKEQVFPVQFIQDSVLDVDTLDIDNVFFIFQSEKGIHKINTKTFNTKVDEKYKKIFDYYLFEKQSTYKTIHIKDNGIYVNNIQFNENPNSPQILLQESMKTIYQNIQEFDENNPENLNNDSSIKSFGLFNPFPQNMESNVKYYHQIGDYTSSEVSAIFAMNDNRVYGKGFNNYGILGLGHNTRVTEDTEIPELCDMNIVEFFDGYTHLLSNYTLDVYTRCMFARNDKNEIFSWGRNDFGRLCRGFVSERSVYFKPEKIEFFNDKDIIHISCGLRHYLALSSNGVVYAWGYNDFGQLGCGQEDLARTLTPMVIDFDGAKIKYIGCDKSSSWALTVDGRAYIWGDIHNRSRSLCRYAPKLIEHDTFKNVVLFESRRWDEFRMVALTSSGTLKLLHDDLENSVFEQDGVEDMLFVGGFGHYVIFMKDNFVYEYCEPENEVKKTMYSNFYEYLVYQQKLLIHTLHISSDGYLMRHQIEVNPYYSENSDQKLLIKTKVNIFEQYFDNSFNKLGEIGSGSYGKVYKVEHKSTKEHFAIKEIVFEQGDPSEPEIASMKEIKSEIQNMSYLDPKFVVKYINSWTEQKVVTAGRWGQRNCLTNYVYIQMEICPQNLDQLIRAINQTIDERFITTKYFIRCHLFVELIEDFYHLHSQPTPVLHRDPKPNNVLVTDEGSLKLCDLGFSKLFNVLDTLPGGNNSRAALPEYTPPEACYHLNSRRGIYLPASDVYGMGVMATKLFEFTTVFHRDRSIVKIIPSKTLNPYQGSAIYGNIQKLFQTIARILSEKPEDRPDCEELLNAKNEWTLDQNILTTDLYYSELEPILISNENQMIRNMINNILKKYGIRFHPSSKNPNMFTMEKRLESFNNPNWDPTTQIEPKQLAQAGFYYIGKSDKVRCFYCDLELHKWKKGDDPLFEHAKLAEKSNRNCKFIKIKLS